MFIRKYNDRTARIVAAAGFLIGLFVFQVFVV